MNEQSNNKPPFYLWIIAVLALVWNSIGAFQYFAYVYITDESLRQYTQDQQDMMANMPFWLTGAFAIAVFAGLFGSLGLLLRKKWATPLLGLSLVAILFQQLYSILVIRSYTVFGFSTLVVSVTTIVIAFILYFLARNWTRRGWLR